MSHIYLNEVSWMLIPYLCISAATILAPILLRNRSFGLRVRGAMVRRCGAYNAQMFWTYYLSCVFVALVLHQEVLVHYRHACSGLRRGDDVVLLIADPQLVDRFAYEDLPEWAHYWTAWLCDVQLRRSWRAAVWRASPKASVILGDLFWGARYYSNEKSYKRVVGRLNGVFGGDARDLNTFAPSIPTYCVMGNHDNAMYGGNGAIDLIRLWKTHFGPLNWSVKMGNTTLIGFSNVILQDAVTGPGRDETEKWLESTSRILSGGGGGGGGNRVVLLTHIPFYSLHRESGRCDGDLRRKGFRIPMGRGAGYENVFSQQLTERVLKALKPSLVVSGDAHDLCEVPLSNGAKDVTLPSFSWMEGTLYHGYGVLSVGGGGDLQLNVCWQPSQLILYLGYAVFGALCIFPVFLAGGIGLSGLGKVLTIGVGIWFLLMLFV